MNIALIDTDVYSALFIDPSKAGKRGMPVDLWRRLLAGYQVLISFQTQVELESGFRIANWGPARVEAAMSRIEKMPTIQADAEVLRAYVDLTVQCRQKGHALQAKNHNADRWVAASAVAKQVPLLSGDGIYDDAPGLVLLAD